MAGLLHLIFLLVYTHAELLQYIIKEGIKDDLFLEDFEGYSEGKLYVFNGRYAQLDSFAIKTGDEDITLQYPRYVPIFIEISPSTTTKFIYSDTFCKLMLKVQKARFSREPLNETECADYLSIVEDVDMLSGAILPEDMDKVWGMVKERQTKYNNEPSKVRKIYIPIYPADNDDAQKYIIL